MTLRRPALHRPGFPPRALAGLLLALLLVGISAAPSEAQDTASISGTIRDTLTGDLITAAGACLYNSAGAMYSCVYFGNGG